MFDHISIVVTHIATSKTFNTQALAPNGVEAVCHDAPVG